MDGCGEGRLDAEELREYLHRGRRRRGAAVTAVLDHGADDDLRVIGRTVAAPPRLVLDPPIAGEGDGLLGRAGLARDRDGELPEDAVRRPEVEMGALPEALTHDLQRRGVDPDLPRRRQRGHRYGRVVRVLDLHQDVRRAEVSAVRDPRVEAG